LKRYSFSTERIIIKVLIGK